METLVENKSIDLISQQEIEAFMYDFKLQSKYSISFDAFITYLIRGQRFDIHSEVQIIPENNTYTVCLLNKLMDPTQYPKMFGVIHNRFTYTRKQCLSIFSADMQDHKQNHYTVLIFPDPYTWIARS